MNKIDKEQEYKNFAVHYKNQAKMKRCRAAVHVEDENDKHFWSFVLGHYLPNDSFEFIPYTRISGNNATGCKICLKYKELGCLSDNFLIAIDSDYRYLMEEPDISANQFVLQTYTYSMENHYCHPITINNAFKQKNTFENTTFDFEGFLNKFSSIIYPIYLYYLYSMKNDDGHVSKSDFFDIWHLNPPMNIDININDKNYLDQITENAKNKLTEIEAKYTLVNFDDLKKHYRRLGLTESNAYLYVRGHNLFDGLISSIIKDVSLEQSKEHVKSFSPQQKSVYFSRTLNSDHEYFSQSLNFDYPEMQKIGTDINAIFNKKMKA